MKVLLIDGQYLISSMTRVLYSEEMTVDQWINVIDSCTKVIRKTIRSTKTTYAAICFDDQSRSFRRELHPLYKQQRMILGADLLTKLPRLIGNLKSIGVKSVYASGYESVDAIATICSKVVQSKPDAIINILGADSRLHSVVESRNIFLVSPFNRNGEEYREISYDKINEKYYGISGGKIAQVLSLIGDTKKNIPGIEGCGEKTAINLLKNYGNLEGILEYSPIIEGKIGDKVRSGIKKCIEVSLPICRLNANTFLGISLSDCKLGVF